MQFKVAEGTLGVYGLGFRAWGLARVSGGFSLRTSVYSGDCVTTS